MNYEKRRFEKFRFRFSEKSTQRKIKKYEAVKLKTVKLPSAKTQIYIISKFDNVKIAVGVLRDFSDDDKIFLSNYETQIGAILT